MSEHIEVVKRCWRTDYSTVTSEQIQVLHAAAGIVAELGELCAARNEAGFLNEAGDVIFYCEALVLAINALGGPVVRLADTYQLEYQQQRNRLKLENLSNWAHPMLEHAKKVMNGYGNVDSLALALSMFWVRFVTILSREGYSVSEARAANVEKLNKRFTKGYNAIEAAAKKDS